MNRRLYHFTHASYALEDVFRRRLKIAEFEDLNDPFELRCVRLTTKEHVIAFDLLKADFGTRFGILCFSQRWDRILQWSNYADRHRGICLGFDVENIDTKFGDVKYGTDKLPFPDVLDQRFMWRMLRTKYSGWRYEEEWRVFVELKEPEWNEHTKRNLYFATFSDELILREVILGAENKSMLEDVKAALKEYPGRVKVSRIQLSEDTFRLQLEELWDA